MAQYPTEAEVLAAVEQAGWLLEQQAVRILGERDFNPRPSWAFADPDEPSTSRELDVWSYRHYWSSAEAKMHVSASVFGESPLLSPPGFRVGLSLSGFS
jgi:hypothetical protein